MKYECLGGLYFNDEKHSCDLPENVSCELRRKRTYNPESQKYISGECNMPKVPGS